MQEQSLGITAFRKGVIRMLSERWGLTYDQAVERVGEYVNDHPNPNDRPIAPRGAWPDGRQKTATAADAYCHSKLLKAHGGVLPPPAIPAMPEEVPAWVTE